MLHTILIIVNHNFKFQIITQHNLPSLKSLVITDQYIVSFRLDIEITLIRPSKASKAIYTYKNNCDWFFFFLFII